MRDLLSRCMVVAIELAHYENARRSGLSVSEHQIRLFAMLEALASAGVIDLGEHTDILLYTSDLLITDFSMPEGHNSRQESVSQGENISPTKPRPRRPLETEHQETASQRFLRRFGAGDTVPPNNTTSRAMKNPRFTASAFPPAYVPSPKVAGGVFSSSAFRLLPPVVFRVAVPVTPPLCLIRETFPQKSLSSRTVKGASDAS